MSVKDGILAIARDRLAVEAVATTDDTFVSETPIIHGCPGKLLNGGSGPRRVTRNAVAHLPGQPASTFARPEGPAHGAAVPTPAVARCARVAAVARHWARQAMPTTAPRDDLALIWQRYSPLAELRSGAPADWTRVVLRRARAGSRPSTETDIQHRRGMDTS